MKMFKKILAGVVSGAAVASALAAPTLATITDSPTKKHKSGKMYLPNGKLYTSYTAEIIASTIQASATLSSGRNLTLYAMIIAEGRVNGNVTFANHEEDAVSGTSVRVQVSNYFYVSGQGEKPGIITRAVGRYNINSDINFELEIK